MKLYRYILAMAISIIMIFAYSARAYCRAPQYSPTTAKINKVKEKIQKLGSGEIVTVILFSGLEYYGEIGKIEQDSFEIDEVDLNQIISIDFATVKKVAKGYGHMNSSTGTRHTSHTRLIVFLLGAGAVAGLAAWGFSRLGRHTNPQNPPNPQNPQFPFPGIQ